MNDYKIIITAIENNTGRIETTVLDRDKNKNLMDELMYVGYPKHDGWSYRFDLFVDGFDYYEVFSRE